MNKNHLVFLVVLPCAAADSLPLSFPERKIVLPPLALSECAKQPLADVPHDATTWFANDRAALPAMKPKLVSRMPIMTPREDVDPRMPIKRPNPSIDYKLTVKHPEIESAK